MPKYWYYFFEYPMEITKYNLYFKETYLIQNIIIWFNLKDVPRYNQHFIALIGF